MSLKVAKRSHVEPFRVMEVLKAAFALEAQTSSNGAAWPVCHMEVGEPGGQAPEAVLSAAQEHLSQGGIGYTNALGLTELRTSIAAHYRHMYGVEVPWDRVAVTAGSSGGFVLAFLSAFDVGDKIGLVEPAYPAYRNIIKALGLEPVMIPGRPEDRFMPSAAVLEPYAEELDGLMVAHPNNPTGATLSKSELSNLMAFCHDSGICLISDEIYHGITYGTPATTALSCPHAQDVIIINSFSKYFCMTGWRLGWMILPDDLIDPVERLAQNLFISAPALSQVAAVQAFSCYAEMDARVAVYRRNRDALMAALPSIGLTDIVQPEGAFYIYGRTAKMGSDSAVLAQKILHDTRVAVTPGLDFDTREGHAWMRLSYCATEATIQDAIHRLQTAFC